MRDVGDLNRRVLILRRKAGTSGGRGVEDWETVRHCAAEVLHASAKTFFQADADWQSTSVLIHIRTPRDIRFTAGCRVECRGERYEVVEVAPDKPLRGFTELRARQIEMEGDGCETRISG